MNEARTRDSLHLFSGRASLSRETEARAFHLSNPRVYELFERFALEAVRAGRSHFSAKMIWERMRWYSRVETTDPTFKLNNNYHAYYARFFLERHPELDGLFETRRLHDDEA